jgi:hypothetical protein
MPEKIVSYKCAVCEQNHSSYDDCVKCEYNHFDFSRLKDGVILLSIFKKDSSKKLEENGYAVDSFKITNQKTC